MEVKKKDAQTAVLHLSGTIDAEDYSALTQVLKTLYEEGFLVVFLDFSLTKYIHKRCLGPLVFYQKKLEERCGKLQLINVRNENVRRLFDMLEFNKVISIENIQ
ncbi:MAG TPA: STAS domain-containing protein [Firmicutes bacterium]|jgi:anti-anti-sigma factor|nr:STAS domain-containing protein [Bacillota bacterium]